MGESDLFSEARIAQPKELKSADLIREEIRVWMVENISTGIFSSSADESEETELKGQACVEQLRGSTLDYLRFCFKYSL